MSVKRVEKARDVNAKIFRNDRSYGLWSIRKDEPYMIASVAEWLKAIRKGVLWTRDMDVLARMCGSTRSQ